MVWSVGNSSVDWNAGNTDRGSSEAAAAHFYLLKLIKY